jgi:hypothetical protein
MYTKFLLVNLKRRDKFKGLGVDVSIILEWILKEYVGRFWTGFFWIRIGTRGKYYEHGNEPSSSIKCRKLLD